jgi:PTS system sucrose-specific IIC component
MPIASAANFAQFGACLAVGLKAKSNKTKQVAIPSALSASLGITEPSIFGVNLRFMKPFIFAAAGGAVGALIGAIFHIGAVSNGVTGIPGYLIAKNPLGYTIVLLVSAGIAFALTWVLWKEDPDDVEKPVTETVPYETAISTEKGVVIQPVAGKMIPASEIADPMFAAETMGPSIGIVPTGETVYAPFDGKVTMLIPTKHAVGVTSDDGIEVLIHVGIDTVSMNGTGFEAYVEPDQVIHAGDKLLHFDRAEIKKAGHPDTVIVVITNGAEFKEVKKAA